MKAAITRRLPVCFLKFALKPQKRKHVLPSFCSLASKLKQQQNKEHSGYRFVKPKVCSFKLAFQKPPLLGRWTNSLAKH